jgi:tetrahydromethanopterin S-methyltransferase subunit A
MKKDEEAFDENNLYLWGGDFVRGDIKNCVAVVLLNIKYQPTQDVALYGSLKTENIGIEKIVANIISNPYIRYVIICGEDIRGHRSGKSLLALHENGIDENHRIINAPGAIPYIENIDIDSIIRFQQQVEIINLIDVTDPVVINKTIEEYTQKKPSCFGKPFIAIRLKPVQKKTLEDTRALHSRIILTYMGKIQKRK